MFSERFAEGVLPVDLDRHSELKPLAASKSSHKPDIRFKCIHCFAGYAQSPNSSHSTFGQYPSRCSGNRYQLSGFRL
jgi:hypothetical protein